MKALYTTLVYGLILCVPVLLPACGGGLPKGEGQEAPPAIYPDYAGITLPPNVAPLHFEIEEADARHMVWLEGAKGEMLRMKRRIRDDRECFSLRRRPWKAFLAGNRGAVYRIRIFRKEGKEWVASRPLENHVAPEDMDSHVVYRLIPPGYQTWTAMGLYERELGSFRQRPLIENKHIDENCVNCHAFALGDPDHMMYHVRGSFGGTVIHSEGQIKKADLKRPETLSAGVYPAWHPSGRWICFSTNEIEQHFHADPEKTLEVFDRRSDLVLYDVAGDRVEHVSGTEGGAFMETFPCWSPDGRHLYFSVSRAGAHTAFDSIHYDIWRMPFDPGSAEFGEVEVVLEVAREGQSASFPRVSPDGRYLLCTVHDYGTFPIWHREADLRLIDLRSGLEIPQPRLNSDESDSFHSWSSDGRWIIFSSRREDGRYTRLYLSRMDDAGQFSKPFMLPQRSPASNRALFFSYNVPELIREEIPVPSRRWVRLIRE